MAETVDGSREQVYRVVEPFSFDHDNRPWVMRKGDLVTPSHPAFRGREALLEAVDDDVVRRQTTSITAASPVYATETAMAAPGHPRSVSPSVTPPIATPAADPLAATAAKAAAAPAAKAAKARG